MNQKEIILRGKIDSKAQLVVYGLRDLEKFQRIQKTEGGVDILMRITILPKKSKDKMIGYIKGKVIPEFTRAFRESGLRLTKTQAEEKIKNLSTISRGEKIENLDFYKLVELIDELKEIAAEHFGFYIDDSVVVG